MSYQIKSLEEALPGDVIFYAPKEESNNWENSAFQIGQTFSRSVCSVGLKQVHAGIVVDPDSMEPFISKRNVDYELHTTKEICYHTIINPKSKKRYIWVSHNYASFKRNHIIIYDKEDLTRVYQILVVSSGLKENDNPEDFRKTLSRVAFCFSRSIPYCALEPCSPVHLWVDPFVHFSLPKDRILYSIAMGILSFAAGCPDIERFEEDIPVSKKTFCAEHVHRSFQVAYGYTMLDPMTRVALEERFSSLVNRGKFQEIVEDLEKSHKDLVDLLYKDLQSKLSMIPDWLLENSVSCTPGRLYTLMTSPEPFKEGKISYVFRTGKASFKLLGCAVKYPPLFLKGLIFSAMFIYFLTVFFYFPGREA